ncbi:hypothetical protein [Salinibacter ruber]|uniref:Uncharacterized protein n=1 Tax=Salinibacter ruber TaxID=146919 RepID=A0AAW5P8V9_9BACT|nr:hypothetical protein [Salinibacter ruber]MCS4157636.1 hypothetical protein [Salinibacter ruber]
MATSASAIKNIDDRRESDDSFSFNRSAESPPTTRHRKRQRAREKDRDWRLRHLAEK